MTQDAEIAAAQTQASGSSFYAGMRVLPKAERDAMFAIYAFCRAVDDIADEQGLSPHVRREGLDRWRQDLKGLYQGNDPGQAAFLTSAVKSFGLRQADFAAVVDGMQMDVEADIRAPTVAVLDLYCDRVASAVGRLSVRVFGMDDESGVPLAHHLGRALQLTNILRDVDEDAAIGRLYIAEDWLQAVGITAKTPLAVLADPRFDRAARRAAALAHEHYRAADVIMRKSPRGRLAAPRLMSGVYSAILANMQAQGWSSPRTRVKLSKPRLASILIMRGLLRR